LNLTLCMTKLRVLVPSFSDFTDISNVPSFSYDSHIAIIAFVAR
jgi:hypothetical protein